MKKSIIAFLTLSILLFAVIISGFKIQGDSFTDFYYYDGEPFKLIPVPDQIFIEINGNVDESAFNNMLKQMPDLYFAQNFDLNDKRDFVQVNKNVSSDEYSSIIDRLNERPEVAYASPVFRMPERQGNPNTLIGVEKEIIAQFKRGISDEEINIFLNQKGMTIEQKLNLSGGKSYVIKIPKGEYSIDYANELYLSGLVNYAEPNLFFTDLLQADPNDPFFPMQWSHRNTGNNIPDGVSGTPGCDMQTDSAWIYTMGDPSVIVSIVDTGIDTLHEDLSGRIIHGLSIDTYNNLSYAWDDNNHGTSTAGIVAATGNNNLGVIGVAPLTRIFGVKIFNAAGNTTSSAIINGLVAAWQRGSWVSSNSWGGGPPIAAADNAILDGVTLGRNGKGVVWSFATGNDNSSVSWPATNPNVISVGGISPCNQRKSPSSCDGENWWGANYGTGLEIVAPCVKVYTTDRTGVVGYSSGNYFASFNGTSSATPNVSGVCALVLAINSNLTWSQVREYICLTADKVGAYTYNQLGQLNLGGWNNQMGYGKINAYKVVKLLACPINPASNPNPTNVATSVSINIPNISWTNGVGATQCEVWFGEAGSMIKVYDGSLISSWVIPSQLNYNTIYNWQIINTDGTCITVGPSWSFTTELSPGIVFTENFYNLNCWTAIGPLGTTNWSTQNTTNAGGTAPELRLNWSPQFNGLSKLKSCAISVLNNRNYTVSFKHMIDWFASPAPSLGLGVSYDNGATYTTILSITPTGNVGPQTIEASFTTPTSDSPDAINLYFVLYCNGDSYNITYWYVDDIVVEETNSFQLSVSIENSWNMVSVPGVNPDGQGVEIWWPGKDPAANVFKFLGGYTAVTTTTPTEGYWMKNAGTQVYNTGDEWPAGGIQIVAHDPLTAAAGWNLIGGYELSVATANITTVPGGLQSGPVYKYSGGYQVATTLDPGYGYWIKLTGAGQIIIPEVFAKGEKSVEYFPDNWGKIVLTDATGINYTLYAVKGEVDLNLYEMPPAPPTGMFDVRFGSNRIAEDINSSVQSIDMSGVTYPVTVRAEEMDMRLMDETGKNVNVYLKSGELVVINDATIEKLMVSGELMPAVYSLEQNYPNPFNPSTVIEFSLPENVGNVQLSIYNMLGEKVAEIVNTSLMAGKYSYRWNASNVSTGMYIYELRTDKFVSVKKMLLLK